MKKTTAAGNGRVAAPKPMRATMKAEVETHMGRILTAMHIDWQNDPHMKDTPRRWARMMIDEVCGGRYDAMPTLTDFPNQRKLDQIFVVGPLAVRSLCSHHLAPVKGQAWIAILPGERLLGLSKFARILRHVMARPQVQEEATEQVADVIEEAIKPRGVAVVIRASHGCMTMRGVTEADSVMTTSVMRGLFRIDDKARVEVLHLLRAHGFEGTP